MLSRLGGKVDALKGKLLDCAWSRESNLPQGDLAILAEFFSQPFSCMDHLVDLEPLL